MGVGGGGRDRETERETERAKYQTYFETRATTVYPHSASWRPCFPNTASAPGRGRQTRESIAEPVTSPVPGGPSRLQLSSVSCRTSFFSVVESEGFVSPWDRLFQVRVLTYTSRGLQLMRTGWGFDSGEVVATDDRC